MARHPVAIAALLPADSQQCVCIEEGSLSTRPIEAAAGCDRVVAAIDDRELVGYQFELQRDLTPEQLEEAVEIKMFQDAGLNPMLEYKIAFSRRPAEDRMVGIGAYAASDGALSHALGGSRSAIGYIDAVLPVATLPYALYHGEILEPKRDIFLYFQEDYLLITLFDGGQYVYSKQQEMGLVKLLDEYALLSRERPERESFFRLLSEQGVDPARYAPEDQPRLLDLRELFSNTLSGVQNILLYISRVAGFEAYDRIFIGSCEGPIAGIEALTQETLEIDAFEFNFWTPFYLQGDPYCDQMAVLALLEGSNIAAGQRANPFNLSPRKRPDALLKRPGGRLAVLAAAALLVALLWPGGYYALGLWQHFKAEQMLSDLGQSKTEFEAQQNQLKALADARDAAQTRFDNARENRENAQALLGAIYEKRVAQDPLSHRLSALYADLDKHGVYLNRLEWREHRLTLQVHAASSDQITALVDALTGKRLRVEMALIEEQNGRHHSDLRVLF